MHLINLLSWLPGYSGFGSYVSRVVPSLEGTRLQLDNLGEPTLISSDRWSPDFPGWSNKLHMRFLQRYSLVQHGINLPELLYSHNINYSDIQLIYSPFFDSILRYPDIPQLITCHDLTPLSTPNSFKAWLRYRIWQPRHCRVATRLIAISRYVADQLVDFGVPSDRIVVIPNGIDIHRPSITFPSSHDLVVFARHDFNKNLTAIFRGLDKLQRLWPKWDGTLRIIGRTGRQTSLLQRLRNSLSRPYQVQFISSLSYSNLIDTLRSSLALVSASTEEGFDYPVLEAKAEGVPTLISDIPVHKEFHSDSSLFFPLDDDGSCFANSILDLCQDSALWSHLSYSGLDLARSLSVESQTSKINSQIRDLSN